LLSFEVTDWSTVTTISVPAGTTIGFGAKVRSGDPGAFCAPEEPSAVAEFPSEVTAGFPLEEVVESGEVVEFRHPIRERKLTIMRERTKALCLIR
jgi:hypothetical protein